MEFTQKQILEKQDGIPLSLLLTDKIGKHLRETKTPTALLNYALDELIKTCSADAGILYLKDNSGINISLTEKNEIQLAVQSELIPFAKQGLPESCILPLVYLNISSESNVEAEIERTINSEMCKFFTFNKYSSKLLHIMNTKSENKAHAYAERIKKILGEDGQPFSEATQKVLDHRFHRGIHGHLLKANGSRLDL